MKKAILTISIIIGLAIAGVFPQTEQKIGPCDHISNYNRRFRDMRLLPGAKIKNFDPTNLEVIYEDSKYVIESKTLKTRQNSVLPKLQDKKKFYWILYSECDMTVEVITEVLPDQFVKN